MRDPLAIVGIGCRFPGGADAPGVLWDLLKQAFDGIRGLPAVRAGVGQRFDDLELFED